MKILNFANVAGKKKGGVHEVVFSYFKYQDQLNDITLGFQA